MTYTLDYHWQDGRVQAQEYAISQKSLSAPVLHAKEHAENFFKVLAGMRFLPFEIVLSRPWEELLSGVPTCASHLEIADYWAYPLEMIMPNHLRVTC